MSSVSGISGSLANSYLSLSSGKRINRAADDAAGLAIAEKQKSQVSGYKAGARNMAYAKSAMNIADGALGSINDYLQRIRELAVSASDTATVTNRDRSAMQAEVSQLLQGIGDVAKNANYNTIPLLDGSSKEWNIATDSDGNGTKVNMADATLEALGIKGFDLTKGFSIKTIDKAISMVNDSRSGIGAKSNALEYGINYNSAASFYATAGQSKIEDLDYPQAVTEKKKQEALLQYSIFMQKKKDEQEKNNVNKMFEMLA